MRLFLIIFTIICSVISLYLIHLQSAELKTGQFLLPEPLHKSTTTTPHFKSEFIKSSLDSYSHASTITELSNGRLLASWYAGSREGAKDVNIFLAEYDPTNQQWSEARVLMSSKMLAMLTNRHIRKLGNPVISRAPNGRLWMFFVSVSVGGWAGSSINTMYSDDQGNSWSTPTRLITSPFWNLSTLVKQGPVYLDDGKILLPIYHEFIGKFSESLLLSPNGKVLEKSRITWGNHSLQPGFGILDQNKIFSLSRNAIHGNTIISATASLDDLKWHREEKEILPNPNSAISVIRLKNGRFLLAANDLPLTRNKLSLFTSQDGEGWEKVKQVEHFHLNLTKKDGITNYASQEYFIKFIESEFNKNNLELDESKKDILINNMCSSEASCEAHFSYPYLFQDSSGTIHLVYTWNKSIIKHASFNTAWLEENIINKNYKVKADKKEKQNQSEKPDKLIKVNSNE